MAYTMKKGKGKGKKTGKGKGKSMVRKPVGYTKATNMTKGTKKGSKKGKGKKGLKKGGKGRGKGKKGKKGKGKETVDSLDAELAEYLGADVVSKRLDSELDAYMNEA